MLGQKGVKVDKKKILIIAGLLLLVVCGGLLVRRSLKGQPDAGQKEDTGENENADRQGDDMTEIKLLDKNNLQVEQIGEELVISNSSMKVVYQITAGTADIYQGEEELPALSGIYAETVLEDGTGVKSTELARDTRDFVRVQEISGGFGQGALVTVNSQGNEIALQQNYYIYEEQPFILLESVVSSASGVKTNYMAPILANKGDYKSNVLNIPGEDTRFLFTPFDNDAFVRYASEPLIAAKESYEVTAVFDNVTRKGMIAGSVTHDTWKTGITVKQGGIDAITQFCVFGGITSIQTRDILPHGYVSGSSVASPKIFLGFYEDYRDGLVAYGRANGVIAPPLAWDKGVPMGWNSWSAVADKVSYDIYTNSSDFVKENLQHNSFSNDGVVYINFDSFWDNLSEYQLKQAAQHVIDNGQIPGIYYTPFTFWGGGYTAGTVEGTDKKYSWQDLALKDEKGTILPAVDGGVSIDPTHPGSIMRMQYMFGKFREWGYKYVKLDFMSHGAREGVFYDKNITTGIQAYNYGMQQLLDILGEDVKNQEFFISLSIAPMFPSQYAHSRRISCDVFGEIGNAEYMLNSLTYGWGMNGTIYPFNDPDHIVVYNSYNHRDAILYNEGLTRYISSAISGTMMIDSDDFRIKEARERAREILTNEEINEVAKAGISFRPVEGNTKDRACDTFTRYDAEEDVTYLAVFNFSATENKRMTVELSRIGLDPGLKYQMYDLWSKTTREIQGSAEITLEEAQPKIFKIYK